MGGGYDPASIPGRLLRLTVKERSKQRRGQHSVALGPTPAMGRELTVLLTVVRIPEGYLR